MNRDMVKALVPNNRELKEHLTTLHKLMSRRLAAEMPKDHSAKEWETFAIWTWSVKEITKEWQERAGDVDYPTVRQLIMIYLQEALALHLELTKKESGASPSLHTEEPVPGEGETIQ